MATRSQFGRWRVTFDREDTVRRYSLLPIGSGCACTDCQTFGAMGIGAFPEDFRTIADLIGIDVEKPAELCHYGKDETGLHLTGGWFHAVGGMESGRDAWTQATPSVKTPDFEKLASGAEFGISPDAQLVAEPFKGASLLQLEFLIHVPWPLSA